MNNKEEVIREIQEVISLGDIENSRVLLKEYKDNFGTSDEIESMSAIVNIYDNNYEEALNNIREGLRYNIYSSDLYYTMGNIYESLQEYNRSYLCYEKALYLCSDEKNKLEIENSIDNLRDNYDINVNNISFIILTYNQLEYTKVCIDSIRKYNNPDAYEIIVVDNHSTDGTVEWLKAQHDIKIIYNNDNKGFPKGCNQGIEIANKDNDIMLLNNDTVIMMNSIFNLRMGLYSKEDVGEVGAVSNSVSNLQQISENFDDFNGFLKFAEKNNIPNDALYEERTKLVGFAVLFKRRVLDMIGYLDERFTPGNYEDDDISLRVIMNGNKVLLCKDSYIHHFGSVSFRNVEGGYNELLIKNNKKFIDKWKFEAYDAQRLYKNIHTFIDDNAKNIFEVNAGGGSNLLHIRNEYKDRKYYAYEKNENLRKLNQKLNINVVEDLNEKKYQNAFDLIILSEYNITKNSELMNKIKELINKESGKIIVILDSYKEKRKPFLNSEVKKFINDFSVNNYMKMDYESIGDDDSITLCIILFDNITADSIKKEAIYLLNQGKITGTSNYLTLLEDTNSFDNINSIREELKDEFVTLNKIKFLIRRIAVRQVNGSDIEENLDDVKELFNIINDDNVADECVIGIINENIINKVYALNFMAIEYFARENYDRVIPYLKAALIIDKEDQDTIYNIGYVLNAFGEKEEALKYLENVKEKNEDIDSLITQIKQG